MVNLARRLDRLERLATELLSQHQAPVYIREGAEPPADREVILIKRVGRFLRTAGRAEQHLRTYWNALAWRGGNCGCRLSACLKSWKLLLRLNALHPPSFHRKLSEPELGIV